MPIAPELVLHMRAGRVALDGTPVLHDVDFRLERGEFLALLGSNGSGKTTLVRALLGLVPLVAGDVDLYGVPYSRFTGWSRIGYVPQRASAASGTPASVMEVVLTGRIARARRLRGYSRTDRAAAVAALRSVGMDDLTGAQVARLSGGQQQRVLIARALAGEPDTLVLDEPVSGVDLEHQERLAEVLHTFNKAGGSVLLVAHSLGATEDLVTREIVMHAGTVTYDGPHHPHHVHDDHVHHPEPHQDRSPLDRATERP